MADNCVSTLHNLLTPRGAPVRDAKAWAGFTYKAIDLFGETSDVVFLGHTWPRWGKENVWKFLKKQADIYKYIYDQTLRLANHGYTPLEIAEHIKLPDELAKEWFNRDYYATGVLNHKANRQAKNADVTIKLARSVFNHVITGQTTFLARVLLGQITYEGSIGKLNELMSLLDEFDL